MDLPVIVALALSTYALIFTSYIMYPYYSPLFTESK